ncbi:zinc finger CCCH domain-containing protein 16 isoform X2 [Manihot esculenta]|uniref:Uncharacterized protein n=2 Tax=Manihot esculenta TaxID=3983 RepID=A0ACB7IAV9_MANES|nr:zinc finger CCCH domain-containing protein 16 isoform X2 [Manihot esculenta]KAG8661343.1 hypothetical protein MANES_02G222200v8 [Manihot esculenta]KAG8661344.1 hypothetical protein MANES_02G222200v8 [Manihot esculenta]
MPLKKELCRNFQRGSCQYGERCKFLHVAPQQQQKPNNNAFGLGSQQLQHQQQNRFSNPFGFGVQSKSPNDFANKQQQFKPFENKWTRFSPIPNGGTLPRQPDNQPQAVNHNCTDPDSCKRLIVEDFENEKPLWKLTCYGHSKNGPCDIVGDVSYEELRAAAYDDSKRGMSLQSIVERERNSLNSKLTEFENLLRNPYIAPPKSAPSPSPFPGLTSNAISTTGEKNVPPAVSSFSQLGASLNIGSTTRPSTTLNNAFGQPNLLPNSSQTSNAFGFGARPSASSSNAFGQPDIISHSSQTSRAFGTNSFAPANAVSTEMANSSSALPTIISDAPKSASNAGGPVTNHIQSVNGMQKGIVSRDASIWLKENWIPGEIPEEAPPDQYI